jgi:hypothetical protein
MAFGGLISSTSLPNDPSQVGLIGSLLLSTSLVWFMPLLKHQIPLLNNFQTFVEEFNATFKNLSSIC